jgi:hypothetical protein
MWFLIPDFLKIWFRPKIGFAANSFDADCMYYIHLQSEITQLIGASYNLLIVIDIVSSLLLIIQNNEQPIFLRRLYRVAARI